MAWHALQYSLMHAFYITLQKMTKTSQGLSNYTNAFVQEMPLTLIALISGTTDQLTFDEASWVGSIILLISSMNPH